MRKAVALAFLLVMVASVAAMGATLTWSGEFKADGEYSSGAVAPEEARFFGRYDMSKSLKLSIKLTEDKGLWDASFDLSALDGAKLGRYIVKLNDDVWQATVWGNYGNGNIGHKGDAFTFVRLAGTNTSENPAFRVTTDVGNLAVTGQVPANGGQVAFNVETDAGDLALGASLENNFETGPGVNDSYVRVVGYGGIEVGRIKLDAAFGLSSEESTDNTALGVGASTDVTDKLNLSAKFRSVGENFGGPASGYDLGATYVDGLFKLTGDHNINTDKETTKTTVGIVYRGSEDNVAFDDLFKDAHYPSNVAFAFGASYTINDAPDEAATTVKADATSPILPDQLWFNANITGAQDEDGYKYDDDYVSVHRYTGVTVNGYAKVSGKLVLKPHVSSQQWFDVIGADGRVGDAGSLTVKLGASYSFTDDVSLRGEIGQTSTDGTGDFKGAQVDKFNSFGVTVKF